jgi:hypothetical protein
MKKRQNHVQFGSVRKGSTALRTGLVTAFFTFLIIGAPFEGSDGFCIAAATAFDTIESRITLLPKGDEFDNDGFRYVILPSLHGRMDRATGGRPPLADGDPNVIDTGELIARKGLFTIHRQPSASAPAALPDYPVVYNLRMKAIGVMTRSLSLKLVNTNDAQPLADEYGLKFSFLSDVMRTAFYSVPARIDLMQLRARLMEDPRIARVTLEILDRTRKPR